MAERDVEAVARDMRQMASQALGIWPSVRESLRGLADRLDAARSTQPEETDHLRPPLADLSKGRWRIRVCSRCLRGPDGLPTSPGTCYCGGDTREVNVLVKPGRWACPDCDEDMGVPICRACGDMPDLGDPEVPVESEQEGASPPPGAQEPSREATEAAAGVCAAYAVDRPAGQVPEHEHDFRPSGDPSARCVHCGLPWAPRSDAG